MRRLLAPCLFCVLFSFPFGAGAQATSASCALVQADSLRATAFGTIATVDATMRLPRPFLEAALDAVSEHIPAPASVAQVEVLHGMVITSLSTPSAPTSSPQPDRSAGPAPGPQLLLRAAVEFTLHRTGAISGAHAIDTDPSHYADTIRTALERIGDGLIFVPFPDDVVADSVALRFAVALNPDPAAITRPLFPLVEPRSVSKDAFPQHFNPSPQYPRSAASRGAWANMLAVFVVTAKGRVDDASLQIAPWAISDAKHTKAFTDATRMAVRRWRFEPAQLGSCPVEQQVVMPVAYRIGGR